MSKKTKKLSKYTFNILLSFSLLVFVFALLSGSEQLGGGARGVILNSPNSLPWIILLAILWFLRNKKNILGGVLILFGTLTVFAFNTLSDPIVFAIISLPLFVSGSIFLLENRK